MMMITPVLLLVPLIFTVTTCNPSDPSDETPITTCPSSLSPGPRAVCAGHAFTRNRWTQTQFITTLHEIIDSFPAESSYYSLGVEFGDHTHLKLGKINNPNFAKSVSINTDPRAMYKHTTIITSRSYKRPVLLFTFDKIVTEAASDIQYYYAQPAGSNMRKRLFKTADTPETQTEIGNDTGCENWEGWNEKEGLKSKTGAVILVNRKYWCPELAAVHFDVIIGHFIESGETLAPEWEKTFAYTFGVVPSQYASVF